MTKQEFLIRLQKGLSGLPQDDLEERLNFYCEMIDDRMEDGLSEDEAVGEIGDADEIISQIIADIPLTKIVKEKIKPKRAHRAWEIVLLALGSPIWLSLLIAAFAVVFSVYAVLWALIIALWAAEIALCGCALACVAAGVLFVLKGHFLTGAAAAGAGLVSAGIAIFFFFGCLAATKGILRFTKKTTVFIKHCFIGKEEA